MWYCNAQSLLPTENADIAQNLLISIDLKLNMKSKPVLLFIGFVWPEITATAASQNIISYLRTFANAGHEVHFASASTQTPLSTKLSQWGINCHHIELNNDSFDLWIEQLHPDIIIFDRFLSEEQFGWRVAKALPHALRVLDCEDLHFLRHARHQLYKKHGYQPVNAPYLDPEYALDSKNTEVLYNEMTAREMASIFRSDLVITLSALEAKVLHHHFNVPQAQIALVPYITEAHLLKPKMEREHFVSIGNFRHAPNIDAVNILTQHLWPKIRMQLPLAKCNIYGAYMPPKIKALHNPAKGLFVHGHVDDHMDILSHARVLLAPIQFGAGVKGKMLDALRCALPSITTPIGAEGISHEQWPGAIVNTEAAFIEQAVMYYNSEDDLGPLYAKVLRDNFDSATNQKMLLDHVLEAHSKLSQRRKQNFMQQMVMHHSLQSHKYMSQWIAAKNAHLNP
jgi:hypothetical protein